MISPRRKLIRSLGLAVVIALSLYALIFLFAFGTSSFLTTAVAYGFMGVFSWRVFKKGGRWQGIGLSLISMLVVLFLAEFFLRYVRRSPITYSEMHGKSYVSMYQTNIVDNWLVRWKEDRRDILTLEQKPFEIRDNTTLDHRFPDYQYNAKGLRGELPRQGSRVILALGDSFTEGAGTPCDSTYPRLLEAHLREHDPTWSVLNAGISGNDPFFDYQMLLKLVPEYDIEHAIFLVNATDVNDVQMRGGMERFLPTGELVFPKGPWWEPIYAVSFVSRLFFHGVIGVEGNLMTPDDDMRLRARAIERIAGLFKQHVVPFAERHGIKVHVVTHPLRHEFIGDASMYSQLVQALGAVQGIAFIDCRTELAYNKTPEGLYWPNDGHFNPEGYARLAACVLGNLKELNKEYRIALDTMADAARIDGWKEGSQYGWPTIEDLK